MVPQTALIKFIVDINQLSTEQGAKMVPATHQAQIKTIKGNRQTEHHVPNFETRGFGVFVAGRKLYSLRDLVGPCSSRLESVVHGSPWQENSQPQRLPNNNVLSRSCCCFSVQEPSRPNFHITKNLEHSNQFFLIQAPFNLALREYNFVCNRPTSTGGGI